jgi:hypothetical protein
LFKFFYIDFFQVQVVTTMTGMPEPNSFLLRAWASDPLISMSLQPKNHQIKLFRMKTSSTSPLSQPFPQLKLEDIKKKPAPFPLIPASLPEPELEEPESDLDLPSSVVEEIEVCNLTFVRKLSNSDWCW